MGGQRSNPTDLPAGPSTRACDAMPDFVELWWKFIGIKRVRIKMFKTVELGIKSQQTSSMFPFHCFEQWIRINTMNKMCFSYLAAT